MLSVITQPLSSSAINIPQWNVLAPIILQIHFSHHVFGGVANKSAVFMSITSYPVMVMPGLRVKLNDIAVIRVAGGNFELIFHACSFSNSIRPNSIEWETASSVFR